MGEARYLGLDAGEAYDLVEFQTPEQIRQEYPNGVRELVDGGTWNTIAGQPRDDSEIALLSFCLFHRTLITLKFVIF